MGSTVKLLIGKLLIRFAYAYVDTHLLGVARGAPLAAFFFGDTRFFFGMKKEMGVKSCAVAARKTAHCVGMKGNRLSAI